MGRRKLVSNNHANSVGVLIRCTDFVNRNRNSVHSLEAQEHYGNLWHSLDESSEIAVVSTVKEAVSLVKETGNQGMQTLVTGSFHLVGALLYLLEPDV